MLLWWVFFRDRRSSDLNHPSFCGVSVANCEVLKLFVLFCDGLRFGSGLALGVDNRRRVVISCSFGKHERYDIEIIFLKINFFIVNYQLRRLKCYT